LIDRPRYDPQPSKPRALYDVGAIWFCSIHMHPLDPYRLIQVAGDALSKAIAQQRERRARGGAQQFATQQPASRPQRAAEAEDLPRSIANQQKDSLVFGAVYEHCDSTGRPQIISSTSVLPEQQFLEVWRDFSSRSVLLACLCCCPRPLSPAQVSRPFLVSPRQPLRS